VTEARPGPDVGALSDAFIAELKHWREVAGISQKGLAKLTEYTPSALRFGVLWLVIPGCYERHVASVSSANIAMA
jgi:hypothetical protein